MSSLVKCPNCGELHKMEHSHRGFCSKNECKELAKIEVEMINADYLEFQKQRYNMDKI